MKSKHFQRRQEAARQALPVTKEQFMLQYVLARASTVEDGFDGPGAAEKAAKTWAVIQAEKVKP